MTIDFKDPVALAQALIRCPSVTPEEGGALSLLEEALRPAGFDCKRLVMREAGTPDVDNLYARLGRKQPNLCFAGHTDGVPGGDAGKGTHPPFGAGNHDGGPHGRGAVDMKGAIAAFVAATLRLLERHGGELPGAISLLITGDEEGPSINGTMKVLDWMRDNGEVMDACIVGEPSNPKSLGEEIKIGRRGSLNAELIVAGRQAMPPILRLPRTPCRSLRG